MTYTYEYFTHNGKTYANLDELISYCIRLKKTTAKAKNLLADINAAVAKDLYVEMDICPSVFVNEVCLNIPSDESRIVIARATDRVLCHSYCRLVKTEICWHCIPCDFHVRSRRLNSCFAFRHKPPMTLSDFVRELAKTIDKLNAEDRNYSDIIEARQLRDEFPDINADLHRNGTY